MSVESLNRVRNHSGRRCSPGRRRIFFARSTCCDRCRRPGRLGCVSRRTRSKARPVCCFSGVTTSRPTSPRRAAKSSVFKMPADQQFSRSSTHRCVGQTTLAVNSRSMLPDRFLCPAREFEAHLKDHSAWPSIENDSAPESSQHTVRIYSGKEKPATAFAAVRYRDYWFWVDNGDFRTKRALTVVIASLIDTWGAAETQRLPSPSPGSREDQGGEVNDPVRQYLEEDMRRVGGCARPDGDSTGHARSHGDLPCTIRAHQQDYPIHARRFVPVPGNGLPRIDGAFLRSRCIGVSG